MHMKNLKEYKYTYQLTRETVRTLPRYAFYDLKTGELVRMYITNVNENTVLHTWNVHCINVTTLQGLSFELWHIVVPHLNPFPPALQQLPPNPHPPVIPQSVTLLPR